MPFVVQESGALAQQGPVCPESLSEKSNATLPLWNQRSYIRLCGYYVLVTKSKIEALNFRIHAASESREVNSDDSDAL